jgi:acyl transferase domain-containing protein
VFLYNIDIYLISGLILKGNCDNAIVGGMQLNLEPFIVQFQQVAGICSPTGVSAVFDESADGFIKGDGIACVFLQKRGTAKRIYATVLTAKMNVDGYKKVGAFFPLSESQQDLMIKTYTSAGIDPLKMTYFEGHLTATRVRHLHSLNS